MSAEAELNALKKLEANKTCVNCETYAKFGHGNICEKFKTFVCSHCKSAHQSFSHRVKSVTMSNWSKEDVDALKEENGGGNNVARHVWLGSWDENKMRKPTESDHVDYFKRFINKVYNDRAFYDESGASVGPTTRRTTTSSGSSRAVTSAPEASPPRRESAPPANVNLLDFSAPAPQAAAPSFDAFGASSWSQPAAPAPSSSSTWGAFESAPAPSSNSFGAFSSAPAPAASNAGFSDGFGAFASAPAPAAPSSSPMDGFGAFASAPVAAVVPTSFDPFAASSNGVSQSAPAPVPSFDPFGASTAVIQPTANVATGFGGTQFGASQPPAPVHPVTGNFSAFDSLVAPPTTPNAYGGYGAPTPVSNSGMGYNAGPPRGMGYPAGNGMGFQPQQQQPSYGQQAYANPALNISKFLDPNAGQQQVAYGNAGRPTGRDPFAGLGLPQH